MKRCGPNSGRSRARRSAVASRSAAPGSHSPRRPGRGDRAPPAALGAAALVLAAALALTRAIGPTVPCSSCSRYSPGWVAARAIRPCRPRPGSARRAHRRARTRGIVPARHGGGTRDGRAPAARSRRHGRHALADVPRCSAARRHRTRQSPRRRRAGLRVGCRSRLGGGRIRRPAVRTPRGAAGRPGSRAVEPGSRWSCSARRPSPPARSPSYPVRRSGRGAALCAGCSRRSSPRSPGSLPLRSSPGRSRICPAR